MNIKLNICFYLKNILEQFSVNILREGSLKDLKRLEIDFKNVKIFKGCPNE